jgi:hypothetical protein
MAASAGAFAEPPSAVSVAGSLGDAGIAVYRRAAALYRRCIRGASGGIAYAV